MTLSSDELWEDADITTWTIALHVTLESWSINKAHTRLWSCRYELLAIGTSIVTSQHLKIWIDKQPGHSNTFGADNLHPICIGTEQIATWHVIVTSWMRTVIRDNSSSDGLQGDCDCDIKGLMKKMQKCSSKSWIKRSSWQLGTENYTNNLQPPRGSAATGPVRAQAGQLVLQHT